MPVSIILPTKDNKRVFDDCVRSLFHSTNYPFKLIIIESNTINHPLDPMYNWQKAFPDRIKIISTSTEGINIKAINIGIKASDPDSDILLIHDDVLFFKLYKRDWLKELVEKLEKNTVIGLATYANNIKNSDENYNHTRWVGSWFCYIPRNTINIVGVMDEGFPIGEDIDYSYRVQKLGLALGEIDYWFEHHQMRENPHNEQSKEIKDKAIKLFREKHKL